MNNIEEFTSVNNVGVSQAAQSANGSHASSTGERELFAIFSGLKVVSIAQNNADPDSSFFAERRGVTVHAQANLQQ